MTLGADVQANLPRLRSEAESLMVSTCIIESDEFTGGVWSEELLDYTAKVPVIAYDGKCQWKAAGTSPREVDAAGQILVVQSPVLKLPVEGSGDVHPDLFGVLTSNPHDPSLVGTRFRIAGTHNQTFGTARRFPVEVVT